jgi:hypothetical protein
MPNFMDNDTKVYICNKTSASVTYYGTPVDTPLVSTPHQAHNLQGWRAVTTSPICTVAGNKVSGLVSIKDPRVLRALYMRYGATTEFYYPYVSTEQFNKYLWQGGVCSFEYYGNEATKNYSLSDIIFNKVIIRDKSSCTNEILPFADILNYHGCGFTLILAHKGPLSTTMSTYLSIGVPRNIPVPYDDMHLLNFRGVQVQELVVYSGCISAFYVTVKNNNIFVRQNDFLLLRRYRYAITY